MRIDKATISKVQSNHYIFRGYPRVGSVSTPGASAGGRFGYTGEQDGSLVHSGFAVELPTGLAVSEPGSEAVKKARGEKAFGARLREKRTEKKISLRKFAEMIGVSSTYLSQVEQGHFSPPTADRAKQIAAILGEDADEWIGLADRVPDDVDEIVKEHPKDMPELMRAARGMTPEQFAKLQQMIRKLRAKEK